jgi:hypothetical protein
LLRRSWFSKGERRGSLAAFNFGETMPDSEAEPLDKCLTQNELASRWKKRPSLIRSMIRAGTIPAFKIGNSVRIAPETVLALESGALAVRPRRRRVRQRIPKEIRDLLDG